MITDADLKALVRQTITAPSEAGTRLRDLHLPPEVGWMVLVLAGVASALLTGLSDLIMPVQPVILESGETVTAPRMSPILWGLISTASAALLTVALWRIGAMMGGQGDFTLMLALMAWLHLFTVLVQIVQVVMLLVVPVLATLLLIAGWVISLRAMAHFVSLAHGFDSLGRAAGVIALSFLAISFALVLFLGATGIGASGGPQ
ncbi:MAG: Yip1 family protein [Salibaculum sp.]|uniref:Yip1 family protein n=1 Tax=Salibaculum sp. TaxID=2855480 RepID=UPI00286FEDB0|nr:Yip1 family protein [Salibaculum sp.]MDR9427960.1 Yip1 family protein [Salibaculum sp.]MDR9481509.1 Yip1 family protein [Salibaculum sp.]